MKRDHDEVEDEEESGKRQCFSRPQGRPPQWRGGRGGRGGFRGGSGPRNPTPDYIKNPQKWTRYSMRDTKVLTDAENKKEGLRLITNLTQNRTEAEDMESDGDEHKIIFKKPTASEKAEDAAMEEEEEEKDEETQLLMNSRKFHKPEYVVGKMKKKTKEKPAKITKDEEGEEEEEKAEEEGKTKKKKEVKLSYLMFEEED